jgi:type IX secretion system PorP/SprF family membrane protein
MKAFLLYVTLCLVLFRANAQQFPQYTQFLFNKIGYNPAASGTAMNAQYEIIFGARTQWIGVNNNPKSEFVSFNYNFVPKRAYHGWHNVGAYIDQDQNGLFTHQDIWLSYTYHLLIQRRIVLAVGVFAGIKQFKLTANSLDRNDPAVLRSGYSVLALPDITPGARLSGKKFFVDASLQQLTMYSQSGIGGKIGAPSKLQPHYIISAGKKGSWNDFNSLVIAVNLRGSIVTKPSIELNVMNYYDKRFGFGMSFRPRNFVSGIVQFRMVHNLVIGLAYDLSINKMLYAAPNTAEIMIGLTPVFNGEYSEKSVKRSVNECTF